MDRYTIISADCHAGAPWEVLRGYLDPAFRDDLDRWAAARSEGFKPFAGSDPLARFLSTDPRRPMVDPLGAADRATIVAEPAVKEGGLNGAWDPDIRLRELDREGTAAEIIFRDGQNRNLLPFDRWSVTGSGYSFEHHWAAATAHNRWLADLCATAPDRHYGVAVILLEDVERAVKEIRWAKKAGVSGGVDLPAITMLTDDPEAFWHHPRHEPIWDTCEELEMPLQLHVGGGQMPNYGTAQGARWIQSMEAYWTNHRPAWHLIWGGVLERHPGLRVCFVESGGSWLPHVLEVMDHIYDFRNPEVTHALLPLRPSEYWRRQCGVGAAPPAGRSVVDHRSEIGLETIMWGSDYPHHEGTWPHSMLRLKEMFAEVPVPEVRKMVGENAARICGIDLKKLEPIAARIGPPITDFGAGAAAGAVPESRKYGYVGGRGA